MSSSVETREQAENWAIEPASALRSGRRRWLLLGLMAVVFFSGGAIGSGLTTIYVEKNYQKRWTEPWRGQKRMLDALNRDLELSDAQSTEVEQILKQHDAAVKKVWMEEVGPKMRTLVKQLDERMSGVLTSEQKPQWQAWLETRRNRVCPPPRAGKHGHGHEGPSASPAEKGA